jgi:hypothetical protein
VVRDEAVLRWVERFRFVTAELVAERFGVSVQRANARLRRLERVGLLASRQRHACEARAVFVTARGAQLLGAPRRRAPRVDVQREHELAIVAMVIELETSRLDCRVLTDRECRRLRRPNGGRYGVDAFGHDGHGQHWPDLVVETAWGRRYALEVELSVKAPRRLQRIIDAYLQGVTYDAVHYLVRDPALARRLRAFAKRAEAGRLDWLETTWPALRIEPLPGTSREVARLIHLADAERAA